MIGTRTRTIHAPSVTLAIVMTQKTTPVVMAPTVLTTAEIFQRGSVWFLNQCRTMPACDSVNDMKTPRA